MTDPGNIYREVLPIFSFPDTGRDRPPKLRHFLSIVKRLQTTQHQKINQNTHENQVNSRQIFQFTGGAHRTTALTVGTGPVPSQAIQKPACLFVCSSVVLWSC